MGVGCPLALRRVAFPKGGCTKKTNTRWSKNKRKYDKGIKYDKKHYQNEIWVGRRREDSAER